MYISEEDYYSLVNTVWKLILINDLMEQSKGKW